MDMIGDIWQISFITIAENLFALVEEIYSISIFKKLGGTNSFLIPIFCTLNLIQQCILQATCREFCQRKFSKDAYGLLFAGETVYFSFS